MLTQGRISVGTQILWLALALSACSKPASAPAPSDTPALVEPASASDANPSPPSSMQTASNSDSPAPAGQDGCHQVLVGGGYQPGVNGGPGIMTPSQTMTVCSAPTAAQPVPHAVAAPAAATSARAEPDTD